MILQRQRQALAFLETLGGEVSNEEFHRLFSRFCGDLGGVAPYEFVSVKDMPHSFTLADDQRKLAGQGLISGTTDWKLTAKGRKEAEVLPLERKQTDLFAKGRGADVIASTQTPPKKNASKPGLVTIGYEGRSLESYLNALLADDVTLLCDVRANAFSRKFGFSKNTLRGGCEAVGIRYEHLPQLGIASAERKGLETRAEYEELFAHYERDVLPKQTGALKQIEEWVDAGERVALTCYEHAPAECHRHCVAEALERRDGARLKPLHL